MGKVISQARAGGITHIAFGDLFLEDVRAYRGRQLAGSGIEPMFPIWSTPQDTPALAKTMLDAGLKPVLTCVDPRHLNPAFAGRSFDAALLAELPSGVDPCGEGGEFHTFCYDGPMFRSEIPVIRGRTVMRDGFCFADFKPETESLSTSRKERVAL
jgi:diphthamide synthase (EF-2-diphthine--ammonia ligase)